ncbi:type II secretion system minor pseudopilin GspI [Hyphomonas sp.]|uniref:type II secretion system minor pseudopilin GspI n=1 Tax=Hyphomonas sp. TaxID=87 RepID=UPI003918AEC0
MDSHRASGFSLIEVLVAMAVFSLAAIPLVQLMTQTLTGAGHIEQRFLAGVVADNVIADATVGLLDTVEGPFAGVESQKGRAFEWSAAILPTQSNDIAAIRVEVTNQETGQIIASRSALVRRNPN